MAIGAPHVNSPAEASRHAQCLDFDHENESGTYVGSGQDRSAAFRILPERDGGTFGVGESR
jgi:hypothetical protein